MKLNLSLLLCLTGVFLVTQQIVHYDYYMITTPSTWYDALRYCRTKHMDLAFVETNDDWERLNAGAKIMGLPTTGWVGLSARVSTWYWVYPGRFNRSQAKWGDGQPDNSDGNELCVAINSSGYWEDYNCAYLKSFICYNASSGTFVVGPYQTDWSRSSDYCQTYHTDLAFISSQTQNSELQQLTSVQGPFWIGVFRDSWFWSNGMMLSNSRWSPGCPNNVDHNDNCGSVNNSLLMDRPCNSLFNFFCYTALNVRKQVVKLTFQGDKRVFDPTVQSAILQQIIQTLEKHGFSLKTTVTWKVQPDGNIFHKRRIDDL